MALAPTRKLSEDELEMQKAAAAKALAAAASAAAGAAGVAGATSAVQAATPTPPPAPPSTPKPSPAPSAPTPAPAPAPAPVPTPAPAPKPATPTPAPTPPPSSTSAGTSVSAAPKKETASPPPAQPPASSPAMSYMPTTTSAPVAQPTGANVTSTPALSGVLSPAENLAKIAARLGKSADTVSAYEMTQNGMSWEDANKAIAEVATQIGKTTPPKPSGYEGPTPESKAANDALTREILPEVAKAKEQAASGDIAGAARTLDNTAGMGGVQAVENIVAQQQGREAVNTSSPSGLWNGTVSERNPASAPTSVIKDTATPEQAKSAADLAKKAVETAANLGVTQTTSTPAPVQQPPAAAPAIQPPVQAPPQVQVPTAGNFSIPAAPNFEIPNPGNFVYNPGSYRLTPEQAQELAQTRADLATNPQLQAIRQALSRRMLGYDQAASALPQALNDAFARNDEEAARAGFLTSGRRFALRSGSMEEMTRQLALIEQNRALANQEASDAEIALGRQRGMMVSDLVDQMRRDDRNFGLQERGQQFAEFDSTRDYGLRSADMASSLAQRALAIQRGQALLPYEVEGAGLGNAQARFDLGRGQALLPYELEGARQSNIGAGLTNEGRAIANDQSIINLDTLLQTRGNAIQMSNLERQAAALELQIAQDPDVGTRAQKQAQLDQIRSQIVANQALAAQRQQEGSGNGLTPYQQYQAQQTQQNQAQEQRQRYVTNYTKDFNVSQRAAEVWQEIVELASTPKSSGQLPTTEELADIVSAMTATPGLLPNERDWLGSMYWAANGQQWALDNLTKHRRNQQ